MITFPELLWKLDYPFTVIVSFLAFLIPIKKRKYFYVPLAIGIILLVLFWLIRQIPGVDTNNILIQLLLYVGEISILFVIIYFTLDIDVLASICILLSTISLQHLSFKVSLQIVNMVDIGIYRTGYYFLFSYPVLFILSIVCYFVFARPLAKNIYFTNLFFNLIALTLVILVEILFSIFEQDIIFLEIENRQIITTIFNVLDIIATTLILVFLYISSVLQKRKDESLTLQLISEKQKERFELAKITIDEINIKYHDLKHMLQNDKSLLNEEDKKEIEKTITNYKAIVQTSNAGLNTIIYESQLKCVKLGIDLNVFVDGDSLKDMKPHHAYSMFSNLIDNAIEEVSKYDEEDKKRIFLNIKNVRESTVITIENYTNRRIKMHHDLPITSKKDPSKHGYGLKSVKRIVDIYHGVFSVKVIKNTFVIRIIFPKIETLEQS